MKKVMFFFGMLVSLLFINTAFAQLQFDCFVKIDNIQGESQDSRYRGYIDIVSFNYGEIRGQSGGELTIGKRPDSTSPEIRRRLMTGTCGPALLSCVMRSSLRQEVVRGVITQNACITRYKLSMQNMVPLEEVVLGFKQIDWLYTKTDARGGVTGMPPLTFPPTTTTTPQLRR